MWHIIKHVATNKTKQTEQTDQTEQFENIPQ